MSFSEELSIKVTAQDEASQRLKDVKKQLKDLEQQQRTAAKTLYDTGSKEAAADVDRLTKSIRDLRAEQKRTAAESARLNREIAKLSTTRLQRTGDWLVKHQKDIQRAGIVGAAAMVLFARSSIKAFAEAEKYQNQLNLAYAKFPGLADVSIDRMRALNTELMNLTGADDDALAGAEALLARFNLTGTEIERLIPLVNDYSIATGTELVGSAEVIGKALLGNTRALKSLGISYKATGDRAKDLAAIQAALEEKVGGAGEAFGKTTAGQLLIAQQSYENLKEEVGAALVPALQALVAILKPAVALFTAMPGPLKQTAFLVGALGIAAMIAVPRIIALKAAMNQAGVGSGSLKAGMKSAAGFMIGPWGAALAAASIALAYFSDQAAKADTRVQTFRDSIDATTGQLSAAGISKIAEQLLTDINPDDWQTLARLGYSVEDVTAAIAAGGPTWDAFYENLKFFTATQMPGSDKDLLGVLRDNARGLHSEVERGKAAFDAAGKAAEIAGIQYEDAGDGVEELADNFADLDYKASDATAAVDGLTRATARLMGIIDRKQAIQNFRRLLREAAKTAGKEGGKANAEEALRGFDAALSTFKAGSKGGAQYTLDNVDSLIQLVKNAGFGKQYTQNLIAGLEEARTQADQLLRRLEWLDGKRVNPQVVLSQLGAAAPYVLGNPVQRAAGGLVTGPGTGTSDSIPALLSNGEFVIRAAAVDRIGLDTLDRLNLADQAPLPPMVSAPSITLSTPAGRDAPLVGSMTVVANTPLDMQRELASIDRRRDREARARTAKAGRR